LKWKRSVIQSVRGGGAAAAAVAGGEETKRKLQEDCQEICHKELCVGVTKKMIIINK